MGEARVRIVRGTGTGPTAVASYDAALQAAGIHNYNLVTVSSILPADVPIEVVGEAPDLGAAGGRLTVVQARGTVVGRGRATASLGWTREQSNGPGVFYEAGGELAREAARQRVENGLEHARERRAWGLDGIDIQVASIRSDEERGACTAVVVAIYGSAEPIL